MTEIHYADHLKIRLKLRKIPEKIPKIIYQTSPERYYDTETRNYIATKRIRYLGTIRDMAIVYDKTPAGVTVITIHPLKPYQKQNRLESGRWKRL